MSWKAAPCRHTQNDKRVGGYHLNLCFPWARGGGGGGDGFRWCIRALCVVRVRFGGVVCRESAVVRRGSWDMVRWFVGRGSLALVLEHGSWVLRQGCWVVDRGSEIVGCGFIVSFVAGLTRCGAGYWWRRQPNHVSKTATTTTRRNSRGFKDVRRQDTTSTQGLRRDGPHTRRHSLKDTLGPRPVDGERARDTGEALGAGEEAAHDAALGGGRRDPTRRGERRVVLIRASSLQ